MKKSDLTMLGIHDSWHDDFLEMDKQGILNNVLNKLSKNYLPVKKSLLFKSFQVDKNSIQVVMLIGGIPNPDSEVNSGVPFASLNNKKIEVHQVLCDAIFNYTGDFMTDVNFDHSMKYWMQQGIFLLNNSLTSSINSETHNVIWKPFIEFIVNSLNKVNNNIVWVLLGQSTYCHYDNIDLKRNVIKSVHPMMDLFDTRGMFVENNIFEKINELYNKNIEWVKSDF